jgi:glycolate dehydrogenase FAD-binding subunit
VTSAVCRSDPIPDCSTHRPACVAEVGDLIRQADAQAQAVYPVGGQTQWDLGLPPTKAGLLLDTRGLDQVIDYPARDMTITVQAGMTVAALQKILATEKQRLPIDVPHADRATLGGSVAANVSGPRRFGCGTLRDYVIGISVVNDEGHEIKAGGRVVKNVAGYDLCKLFVGSLGTLGVITQLTFKLRPLPEEHGLFAFACPAADLEAALTQIHNTRTRPVCVDLLNPAAARSIADRLQVRWPTQWTIAVGFEDNAEALKWQVKQFVSEIGGRFDVSGRLDFCANPYWQQLVELPGSDDFPVSFKAGIRPAALAAFSRQADQLLDGGWLQVHAANGIVSGHAAGGAAVGPLRELAAAADGYLVVTRCPAALKSAAFVWGPPRPDVALMKTIKAKLDPRRLFNPGRFVDGI